MHLRMHFKVLSILFFSLAFVLLMDLHKVLREKERLVQLPSSPNTKKEKNIKTKTRKRKKKEKFIWSSELERNVSVISFGDLWSTVRHYINS